MIKLYPTLAATLACGLFAVSGLQANAQKISTDFKVSHKSVVQKKANALRTSRANEALAPLPQKIENYSTEDVEGKVWTLSSVQKLQYDGKNNLVVEQRTIYTPEGTVSFSEKDALTYNEQGNLVEKVTDASMDGQKWDKVSRLVVDYDKVRPNMPILNEYYMWDPETGEWLFDEENEGNFFLDIERDDKNRVTKLSQTICKGFPISLSVNEFTYYKDDPARTMRWSLLSEDEETGDYVVVPTYYYEKLKWRKSDSQFYNIQPNAFYPFDADPNNELAGYSLYQCNEMGKKGPKMADYSTEYDEQGRISSVNLKFPDGISYYTCTYKYDKDKFGSFEMYESAALDEDYDGVLSGEEQQNIHSVTTLNKYGDIIKEESFLQNPATKEEVLFEGYGYEMDYDKNDLLRELRLTYFSEYVGESGGYTYLAKLLYSDYTNETTGVEAVSSVPAKVSYNGDVLRFDNADGARYRVCDCQGKTVLHGVVTGEAVSMSNLPSGMYIVKVSGKHANNAVKLIKK